MAGEGGAGNGNQTPKMVEVEVGGRKFQVEESAKDLLMTQSDYTRKTQAVADERKALDAEKVRLTNELEAGKTIMSFLQNDETAAKVMEAIAAKDMKKARSLLEEDAGGDEGKLSKVEKELASLKMMVANQSAVSTDSAKKADQKEEAKKIVKELGLEWDEIYPEMEKVAREKTNPYVPWALFAGKDKMLSAAIKKAKEEGRKDALKEFIEKSLNSPTMTGGNGTGDTNKPPENTREAANRAYLKLVQKKDQSG